MECFFHKCIIWTIFLKTFSILLIFDWERNTTKSTQNHFIGKKPLESNFSPNNVHVSLHHWRTYPFDENLICNVDLCQGIPPPLSSNTASYGRTCPDVLLTFLLSCSGEDGKSTSRLIITVAFMKISWNKNLNNFKHQTISLMRFHHANEQSMWEVSRREMKGDSC